MKSSDKRLNLGFAIVLTVVVNSLAPVQPASAQLLELATGALSILNSVTGKSQSAPQSSPPPVVIPQQPIPNQTPNLNLGAGNFNGNNFNLCISGCLPNAAQPVPPGAATFPTSTVPRPVMPAPQVVQPAMPAPQTVQPAPNRPVLTIPPISLPPNF